MPGPDVRANDNVLGEMSTEPTAKVHSGVEPKAERKLTVLETHGYVLGRTIGSGSYATVKVATSDRHNCQVAIKIISKFQAPGDYLKKFLPREIEVVKGLKHENLIRFLQAIETTHRVYIVMEYAENGSLLDIIRKDQHIDEARGRRWFKQLVEAVDYCHERGVVHRDIKCENLLMDHGLNIKLSDFGFARGHMKPKNGVYALSETFCGSYAYASPEILKGVPYRPQDSDIWSMGVVLYAIVYGRLPFDDTNYTQLLKQVQNKVSFPREPKVSTECRKLITKVLSPLKMRVKIPQILADPWLNPNQPPKDEEVDTAQENAQISKDEIKSINIGTATFDRKLEEVATSDRHNCQVAIKIISKFQAPGDYLKKFLPREIEVVKGLKHENLIRFLQAIETTHRVYIVMEYAENGSLLDIIRKDQHIDEARGRRWFKQLVEAVDYCHERGVVHRDIKCENLLMDHGLNIKLSDFGFARGHMKPKNGVYALSETFCGSYAYASPEILKGVPYRPQDSDIWSMGVVLYAIVYGRLPFDDTNYTQLLKVQNKVSFPREPKVSTECRKLITKVLSPLKMRVKIPQILADPWLNPNQPPKDEEVDTAQENARISKVKSKA